MKILMVCLGNICRSPGTWHYARSHWYVPSTMGGRFLGTGAGMQEKPQTLDLFWRPKKHGLDISKQRARKITNEDIELFDLILQWMRRITTML